jgi:SAM-dependent methyltransferase
MPDEQYWETLLDVPAILDAFGFGPETGEVAELGCGYGTFSVPLAARVQGIVQAIDIDPVMTARTTRRAQSAGLGNVRTQVRDVLRDGFGLPAGSCDAVLLFNILHGEEPVQLLQQAARILRPGGVAAVIHWRSDLATPRGPTLAIRPRPSQVLAWARAAGGLIPVGEPFLLPPWHYGIKLRALPADSR